MIALDARQPRPGQREQAYTWSDCGSPAGFHHLPCPKHSDRSGSHRRSLRILPAQHPTAANRGHDLHNRANLRRPLHRDRYECVPFREAARTSTGSIGGLALKSQYGGNAYLLGTFGGATAQTGSTSATGYSISGGFALDRPKFKSKWLNLLLPKWGGLVALKSNTTQTVTTEIRLAWRVSK